MQAVITVLLLNNMNVISRIQELANTKGVSMYIISQDTGISQSVLSRLKTNKTAKLSRINLEILANYFCVNPDWLATGEGDQYAAGLIKDTKIYDEGLWERIEELAIKLFSMNKTSSGIDYEKMSAAIAINPQRLYSIIRNNEFPTYSELLNIVKISNLNINWLITGNGPMLKEVSEESTPALVPASETRPRIPYTAAAGSLTNEMDGILESQCEQVPIIRVLPAYDFTIFIKGDSMFPRFESGDEVACKKISNTHFIQWGKVHVLDTAQGIILKRIYEDGDKIRCVSYNPEYPDFSIPKNEIYSMSLVVGLVRI